MPLDEFESVAFGKPFPDRRTEWYPYESKMVCDIALSHKRSNSRCPCIDVFARYIGQYASIARLRFPYEGFPLGP